MSRSAAEFPGQVRYCRNCLYDLRASEGQCPECGTEFDVADPQTYLVPRPPLRQMTRQLAGKAWRPLCLALGVVVCLYVASAIVPAAMRRRQLPVTAGKIAALRHLGAIVDCDSQPGLLDWWLARALPRRYVPPPAERVLHVYLKRPAGGEPGLDEATLAASLDLPDLLTLQASHVQLGDVSLRQMEVCTHLADLDLKATAITDAGLRSIGSLSALQKLSLAHTSITDEGMRNLKSLWRLEILDLSGTAIGDAGVRRLASLSGLRELDISGTRATDASLSVLGTFPDLKVLILSAPGFSVEAVDKFRSAHPRATVALAELAK